MTFTSKWQQCLLIHKNSEHCNNDSRRNSPSILYLCYPTLPPTFCILLNSSIWLQNCDDFESSCNHLEIYHAIFSSLESNDLCHSTDCSWLHMEKKYKICHFICCVMSAECWLEFGYITGVYAVNIWRFLGELYEESSMGGELTKKCYKLIHVFK